MCKQILIKYTGNVSMTEALSPYTQSPHAITLGGNQNYLRKG